ncbi:unnamed protein product [Haemonchus placei]|uniref:TIP_N domain-containing protein n=1 Tax=Haemonchus placei TaxID=6290 RepID=A0A0N4W9F2_HAEPC|nr:unnamed protein product [Haemonchus placei]
MEDKTVPLQEFMSTAPTAEGVAQGLGRNRRREAAEFSNDSFNDNNDSDGIYFYGNFNDKNTRRANFNGEKNSEAVNFVDSISNDGSSSNCKCHD